MLDNVKHHSAEQIWERPGHRVRGKESAQSSLSASEQLAIVQAPLQCALLCPSAAQSCSLLVWQRHLASQTDDVLPVRQAPDVLPGGMLS